MGRDIIKKVRIDPATGEIIHQDTFLYYDGFNEKGYKYRYKADRILIFWDCIPSTLSKDAFLLLYMIAEMANEDNALVYRITRKSKFSTIIYKPLTKEDIFSRLRWKYGENKFEKYWRELKKHCIKQIKYHEYLTWIINPAVICRCRQVPPWLYEEFANYMMPYMPKAAIKKMQNLIKYN